MDNSYQYNQIQNLSRSLKGLLFKPGRRTYLIGGWSKFSPLSHACPSTCWSSSASMEAAEFGMAVCFLVVFVLTFTIIFCKSSECFLLLLFTRASVPLLSPWPTRASVPPLDPKVWEREGMAKKRKIKRHRISSQSLKHSKIYGMYN